MDPAELVSLIASLNPDNTPGRLAVIVRMGAKKLREKLPALIEAVEQAGQVGMHGCVCIARCSDGSDGCGCVPLLGCGWGGVALSCPGLQPPTTHSPTHPSRCQVVAWVCDPMHGNTESCGGFKTRRYENVRAEVEAFFDVHDALGTVPGGVHLEMTGEGSTVQ